MHKTYINLEDEHYNLLKELSNVQRKSISKILMEIIEHYSEERKKIIHPLSKDYEFSKIQNENNEDPILNIIGCFSGETLSSKDIDEEIYGKRVCND